MSAAVTVGENVLFFPKAYFSAGLTNAEVCVVCTKTYVFVVPKKDFTHFLVAMRTRKYAHFGEGIPVVEGVERLLAEPELTVAELEERLVDLLGADQPDRVIKVAELKSFKTILFGPLSQARIKHQSDVAPRVLSCKGKGAMKQFKAFYA
ncbi:MAG: hypothetical protein IPL61_27245 [Myxococcales bacterium]|nr:hypothetical protein [Myxococcales bacterium]